MAHKRRICPSCGSTNVYPCWDAETDTYGLYSCEDCEIMRDEDDFPLIEN